MLFKPQLISWGIKNHKTGCTDNFSITSALKEADMRRLSTRTFTLSINHMHMITGDGEIIYNFISKFKPNI